MRKIAVIEETVTNTYHVSLLGCDDDDVRDHVRQGYFTEVAPDELSELLIELEVVLVFSGTTNESRLIPYFLSEYADVARLLSKSLLETDYSHARARDINSNTVLYNVIDTWKHTRTTGYDKATSSYDFITDSTVWYFKKVITPLSLQEEWAKDLHSYLTHLFPQLYITFFCDNGSVLFRLADVIL